MSGSSDETRDSGGRHSQLLHALPYAVVVLLFVAVLYYYALPAVFSLYVMLTGWLSGLLIGALSLVMYALLPLIVAGLFVSFLAIFAGRIGGGGFDKIFQKLPKVKLSMAGRPTKSLVRSVFHLTGKAVKPPFNAAVRQLQHGRGTPRLDTEAHGKKTNIEAAQPARPRFCDKCGRKLLPGNRFCDKCGKAI